MTLPGGKDSMTSLLRLLKAAPSARAAQQNDAQLREQILSSLERSSHAALASVHCRVQDGVVELSGDVPSYYMKQVAQSVVLCHGPLKGVRNLIRVD
jgi:osmotically-inducible protein OsmY